MPLLKNIIITIVGFLISEPTISQSIPVEIFIGNEKTTLDIMFFNYFKTKGKEQNGNQEKWLFFNRNRASIDYRMTTTSYKPQYGFTEAVSYNDKNLNGFAPVAVIQLNTIGVYPKVGIQYFKFKKNFTIFSWLVFETLNKPNMDFFLLGRYYPKLIEKLQLFSQIELINSIPTDNFKSFTFIQRIRLGLKKEDFQFGLGTDFTTIKRNNSSDLQNIGLFIRYEFKT